MSVQGKQINVPMAGALILFAIVAAVAVGCNKQNATKAIAPDPVTVTVQTAQDRFSIAYSLDFPAMITAGQEAKVVAKTNGTLSAADFKVGQSVSLGDHLFKIDDVNGSAPISGFSAYQIKQAQLAAQQAFTSYQMAVTSYNNLVITSAKDLKQAEIAKNQALTGKTNLSQTTADSLKSAQLAYDTAKIATEQANLAYENRKAISNKSATDTATNAGLSAKTAVDSCSSILTSLVNTLDIDRDRGGIQTYSNTLGMADPSVRLMGRAAYEAAKAAIDAYRLNPPAATPDQITSALDIASKTKALADASKKILDNTPQSAALPMTSMAGVSLNSLQSAVAGYQTQANALVTQLTNVQQGVTNTGLNNDATLDGLQKAYELAKQQERSAAQNLENLKSSIKAQIDSADFGAQAADNQYASTQSKLDTQLAVSKSQADLAGIQYQNALTALNNLVDMHESIAPISGVITKKYADNGATVSAGQVIAVIDTTDDIKIQFFIDQSHLDAVRPGLGITVKNSDGQQASGTILAVTPQADAVTKRFLVEAKTIGDAKADLTLGTIATVTLPLIKIAPQGSLLLPLSAVDIGQNGASIFVMDSEKAKKVDIKIGRIEGETAEVIVQLPEDAKIIVDGNKLVQDGDTVKVAR
ncbi:MAG: efflux RND transporter periplasmic adaptor subunit [Patescibacteria group bacterium]|nr:efflux RND transporter periplasmic adaptor subunit [Patescibacteria group bacterium]